MTKVLKIIGIVLLFLGFGLLSVNIYGLSQNIRSEVFPNQDLRFENDVPIPFETALKEIQKKESETKDEYLFRLSKVIADSLAHIKWRKIEDNSAYNMHVPIWENYILFAMGLFSGIPEFERYHFSNHLRSLKRGIGICGDASMVMSQILDGYSISNQLLVFPGHVVVVVQNEKNERVYDPDFGVALPFAPEELKYNSKAVGNIYMDAGYTQKDAKTMEAIYKGYEDVEGGFHRFNGVKHFITKKYYFEKLAYALKWPVPFLCIILGVAAIRSKNQKESRLQI